MTTGTHPSDHPDVALRAEALESLLLERGLIDPNVVDGLIKRYENDVGPMNGAKVVAKAWTDPDYRQRLLEDGTAAIAELGYSGPQGEHIVVLENCAAMHNVVVCTLCSCYPWPILGLPPSWYKDPAYRARIVREPRPARRDGVAPRRVDRDQRVGQQLGGPLLRAARAPGGDRRSRRGGAGRAGDPRRDGRRRQGARPVSDAPVELATAGPAAPPRSNGELVFEAPWESRLFGVTMALQASGHFAWDEFQRRLIAAVGRWEAEHPDGDGYRYYERWAEALESLLGDRGIVALGRHRRARRPALRRPAGHDHDHDH